MTPLSRLAMIYGVYLAAAMSPGPSVLFVMRSAMASRERGLRGAWGIATGTTVWVVVATVGFSILAGRSQAVLSAFRCLGGSYFLYMGARYGRDAARKKDPSPAGDGGAGSAYLHGLATNLTNPATIAFFLGLLGLYFKPGADGPSRAAVCLGIAALSCAWYSALAWACSTRRMIDLYAKARRPLDAALALVFAALGADLLFNAVSR